MNITTRIAVAVTPLPLLLLGAGGVAHADVTVTPNYNANGILSSVTITGLPTQKDHYPHCELAWDDDFRVNFAGGAPDPGNATKNFNVALEAPGHEWLHVKCEDHILQRKPNGVDPQTDSNGNTVFLDPVLEIRGFPVQQYPQPQQQQPQQPQQQQPEQPQAPVLIPETSSWPCDWQPTGVQDPSVCMM